MGFASLYLPLRVDAHTGRPHQRSALATMCETLPETFPAWKPWHRADYRGAKSDCTMSSRAGVQRSNVMSACAARSSRRFRMTCTPLTAMVGLADSLFLIKPALPDPALETAQALHEQATRLAGLVGNLLDMARLNAGGSRSAANGSRWRMSLAPASSCSATHWPNIR